MKTKIIIFGITGDLSVRKLLPAVQAIETSGRCDELEIIGVSRRLVDINGLLVKSLGDKRLQAKVSIFTMDLAHPDEYGGLREFVALKHDEQALVYLSVPPTAATQIVDFMGVAGFNGPNVKLLFEKPFGVDYASAADMVERTARYYEESQIYRIDHYLAKEMAQNLVAFRSANQIFRRVWNREAIEKIEVLALEKIGIEGRTQFYEQTGALRDFLQGHLMQLLALTIMDLPSEIDWSQLSSLRLKALNDLKPADPGRAYRAQYEGYQSEAGNVGSLTETFVSVTLESDADIWRGVPFTLMTGKALEEKATEVRVYFRHDTAGQQNRLVFRIQPNEGIEIDLITKRVGYDREFESQKLDFTYSKDAQFPDAYEQVLVDAIRSSKSLFTSSGEVLRSWQIVQPLLDEWGMEKTPPPSYAPGSSVHNIVG